MITDLRFHSRASMAIVTQAFFLRMRCGVSLVQYTQMMRRMYIHQHLDWPHFHWDWKKVAPQLASVRHRQGLLLGRIESLAFETNRELTVDTVVTSVVSSSRIEGETLDAGQVRSSVARRLGLDVGGVSPSDRSVDGVVEMMIDATERCEELLTKDRLFGWHGALFPTGFNNMGPVNVGKWRDDATGPMRVVSGPIGRQRVHFEAPPAGALDGEMGAFIDWFNRPDDTDWVIRAALAHLWFVTIHPFDDGNGRIARALTDMALARSDGTSQRSYSMSDQVLKERRDYYRLLEQTQRGTLDITDWMMWFLACLERSIDASEEKLSAVISKSRFWRAHQHVPFNTRQRNMVNRLIDGFSGNLTTSRWARMTRCSHDTALRDITDLIDRGILVRNPGGGRRTSYSIADVLDWHGK